MELEWKVPQWSNAIERDRARTYHQAYSALIGLYCLNKAAEEVRAGRTKSWTNFKVPEEAVSVGFHEAARGVLSHHMVIRDGKIANYQPYPPTPWNASSRDVYGTPGPVRGRGAEHARSSRRTAPTTSRASTSCGRSAASTPACPAACTCTSAADGEEGDAHADRARMNGRVVELGNAPAAGGEDLVDRVQALAVRLESIDDDAARATAHELLGALLELYGAGLERIMDDARGGRPGGRSRAHGAGRGPASSAACC